MSGPLLLPRARLHALLGALRAGGYRCIGPQVRDGAIVYDELADTDALPAGYGSRQAPGTYRLERREDARCFAWCPVGIDITEEAAAICAPQEAPA